MLLVVAGVVHMLPLHAMHTCSSLPYVRVLSSEIDVKALLADHADLVRSQFRRTYPHTKSLPQFENIKVTPLSRHVVPANGKPHCIVGGVRNEPDLVLDSWNHPPSVAAERLRTFRTWSGPSVAVGVGLPGSGKTTAVTQLADDHAVIMVTASSWDDNDGTLPPHYSSDWRQLLGLAQARAGAQSATSLAENKLWVRMAWLGLVYTRLVMYQEFLDMAQGTIKEQLRQWLLVQQEFDFTQLEPVASKLQPSAAVVGALEAAVRTFYAHRSRAHVIVVIDEAQRVSHMFPLKLPRMDVRTAIVAACCASVHALLCVVYCLFWGVRESRARCHSAVRCRRRWSQLRSLATAPQQQTAAAWRYSCLVVPP